MLDIEHQVTIPKIIHQIWLGTSLMHPLMMEWRHRLRTLHPSWEVVLWSEGPRPNTLVRGDLGFSCIEIASLHPDLLDRSCHLSQKSNIWRYEIINKFGGIYLDTDVEVFKPLDDLVLNQDAFTVERVNHPEFLECAAFGAVPHHPWTEDLVAQLTTRDPAESLSMGVHYFSDVTRQHTGVTILPPGKIVFEYPDPYPWDLPLRSDGTRLAAPITTPPPPGAYATHRWSSLWFPESFKSVEGKTP